MSTPSFESLRGRLQVRPIPGCPGRYVASGGERCTLEELVGAPLTVRRFTSPRAKDPVLVARIVGGGMISYARPDGSFVHTLCDQAGFVRKLAQLGIPDDDL